MFISCDEITQTIKMIQEEHLDIRTVTMGISLLDCAGGDGNHVCRDIYDKICRKAERLVSACCEIESEFGIPIVNKRIAVTPIALLARDSAEQCVKMAAALERAADATGVNFIGGYSALDYLIKVKEMPFTQAVETIMGNLTAAPPAFAPAPKAPKEKVLLLPQANRSATHAVEYLHRRGIDDELIDFCIQTGRLYESYPYHNVVFVGMDADGKPRYANQRGIGSDFIGDANGSDKHYSFGIPAVAASDTLHLFESAVDLLSYGTLQKLDGKDWRSENLLSLAGVYKPRAKIEESSLPAALVRYLSEHPHIRRVALRLDNDATGRIAAETIKTLLPRKYAVTVDTQPPPQGKDYNDCLCMRLGLPITKRGERSKER